MHIKTEIGRVVWHDLMTHDVTKARRFYADLLGWEYQIEHTSDFVWKSGEAEYPLIRANGGAHGGFVDFEQNIPSHWIAYVRVEDVDAVTTKAKALGASIEREPFDTPGVGRSSVIRDPQGAVICPHLPTHNFLAPSGTFLWDELITDDVESATQFYSELLGWKVHDINRGSINPYTVFKRAGDINAAGVMKRSFGTAELANWITYIATNDIDATIVKAKTLGASVHMEGTDMPNVGRQAVLVDPTNAIFGLLAPSESRKQ